MCLVRLNFDRTISADPCCWDLVVQSISCYSKTLNVNNLEKSVGVFSLESIYKTSKKLEDQVLVEKLFGLIIDQVGFVHTVVLSSP